MLVNLSYFEGIPVIVYLLSLFFFFLSNATTYSYELSWSPFLAVAEV